MKSEWTFDKDFVGIEELCRAAIKDRDLFQYITINEDGIRSAIRKGVREIPGVKIYQKTDQAQGGGVMPSLKNPWPIGVLQGSSESLSAITGKEYDLFTITRILDNLWGKFVITAGTADDDIIQMYLHVKGGDFGLAVGGVIKAYGIPTSLTYNDYPEEEDNPWTDEDMKEIQYNLVVVFLKAVKADSGFIESVLSNEFEIVY